LPTFDVVHNQSPEGLQLLSDLRRHGFVALLGSVISDWDPSGLPPGLRNMTSECGEVRKRAGQFVKVQAWVDGLIHRDKREDGPVAPEKIP
jgi:hypothetical protein